MNSRLCTPGTRACPGEQERCANSKNRVKSVRFRLRPGGVPAASGYRRSVSPDKLMPENLLLLLCRPISNDEAAPQAKLCRRMELFIKSLPRTRSGNRSSSCGIHTCRVRTTRLSGV